MHAIEKILARAAGKKKLAAGEIANCRVDLAGYGLPRPSGFFPNDSG